MRFFHFAKIFRFASIAAFSAAAAFVAILALSLPASATSHNTGNLDGRDDYAWDTDNLKFGVYSARSFAIPHLTPAQRGNHEACQSGVADGFFQLDPSVRNDLPMLTVTVDGDGNGQKSETAPATCTEFAQKQDLAVRNAGSNGGYYLDSGGILRQGGLPARITMDRSSLPTQIWVGGFSIRSDSPYARRVDYSIGGRSDFRSPGVPTVPHKTRNHNDHYDYLAERG